MVVAVGAHYRSQAVTREDMMLHIVSVRPTVLTSMVTVMPDTSKRWVCRTLSCWLVAARGAQRGSSHQL